MNTNSIIVHNIDVLQFEELLKSTVKEQFDNFKKSSPQNNEEELLTREETYKLLKIDSSTLWAWTKKGKIKAYGIANRRYYKRSEILECLILLKN
ncbi:helix-turn-helix domain-containing protein [Flavobacterium piscis]|uniref:CRISPR/Cas system endoribonuclease Cas6 (RAMP superfamily) n=1 Tax=Flavobacterium piscis TaxID=1114874 RepID=A0ABU1Y2M0_9FLAO|nr:helix-turn-helix domain-containing protein [Flavobacterium piscis]MDR7208408.1 CRISPR/Cas system endoribonuclease Cas6 (RAMP superfamily) [Flavobacterium piscis]